GGRGVGGGGSGRRGVGGRAGGGVAAGPLSNYRHDTPDALLLDRPPGPGLGEQIGPGFGQIEQLPEVGRQGAAARRAGRDGAPADQPLFRVEPTKHGRALPEESPGHGQTDEIVGVGGDVVTLLTRIDRDDLARLAAPASPDGACVPRQYGSEPKAAGGKETLGLKPPVAGCVNDLDPSELKELEFAPERPAAELPEAKFPPAEPLGQLVGVTGPQRLQVGGGLLVAGADAAHEVSKGRVRRRHRTHLRPGQAKPVPVYTSTSGPGPKKTGRPVTFDHGLR